MLPHRRAGEAELVGDRLAGDELVARLGQEGEDQLLACRARGPWLYPILRADARRVSTRGRPGGLAGGAPTRQLERDVHRPRTVRRRPSRRSPRRWRRRAAGARGSCCRSPRAARGPRRAGPPRPWRRRPCCRGGRCRRPRRWPPRGPARSTTSTSILSMAPARARARRTASATPPQAATWLSLMRMPSPSANRWFVPPPARTAAFSSRRQPGVVLRVSRRRVFRRRPRARRRSGGWRRDAGEPLQEVERGALRRQQRAERTARGRRSSRRARARAPSGRSNRQSAPSRSKTRVRHGRAGEDEVLLREEAALAAARRRRSWRRWSRRRGGDPPRAPGRGAARRGWGRHRRPALRSSCGRACRPASCPSPPSFLGGAGAARSLHGGLGLRAASWRGRPSCPGPPSSPRRTCRGRACPWPSPWPCPSRQACCGQPASPSPGGRAPWGPASLPWPGAPRHRLAGRLGGGRRGDRGRVRRGAGRLRRGRDGLGHRCLRDGS